MTSCAEQKVFKAIGEWLVKSPKRTDPVQRAIKEAEDVLDIKKEQATVDAILA